MRFIYDTIEEIRQKKNKKITSPTHTRTIMDMRNEKRRSDLTHAAIVDTFVRASFAVSRKHWISLILRALVHFFRPKLKFLLCLSNQFFDNFLLNLTESDEVWRSRIDNGKQP